MYIINSSRKILAHGIVNKKLIQEKLRTTGIYLLVPIIGFLISVFTSPIFAKYLSAEEFGFFGFYNTTSQFVNIIFGLSFQTYYMSVYYRESEEQRRKIQVSILLFSIVWNVIFFPVSYCGFYLYLHFTHSQVPFFPLALLSLSVAAISNYKAFVQINFRLAEKPLRYLLWTAGNRVLVTLVSLYFAISSELSLVGRMAGILIVEGLYFFVSLYIILKGSSLKIDRSIVKNALRKVLPLLPSALLFLPILSYDNIALERMNEPGEMGLYNIGKGIAVYLYTALFAFYQTFEPSIYKHTIEGNIRSLKKISLFLTLLTTGSLICFWLISPLIINFLTAGKYNEAVTYANITAVTYCIMIVFSIFDAIIMAKQETKKQLLINAIALVLSLIYYTVAGAYFKQIGVAVATILSYLSLILLQIFFIRYRLKIVSN